MAGIRLVKSVLVVVAVSGLFAATVRAAGTPAFVRTEDVVYGRKFGTALTMDVFTPREHANGLGVILVVSGGWFSSHENINPGFVERLIGHGYTVFAVVHGSNPKFTIPEIFQDMSRAVRFIRFHARDYKIDPDRLGIFGMSAGGHLSLMQGTAGEQGKSNAKDPVERTSSRVQAVACFFPPTDFLNYGKPGEYWEHHIEKTYGRGTLAQLKPVFDFHERSEKTGTFERITDEAKVRKIVEQISPITHVSKDDPPMLIIHGDADKLVPIQQAESFVAKLKEVDVEAKLVVKPGAGHGWKDLAEDMGLLVDWFDRQLKDRPPSTVLFNGKDLAGWKIKGSPSRVEWVVGKATLDEKNPGKLAVSKATDGDLINPLHAGDLYTEQKFGDGTLEVELMIPRGSNSGVYVMGEYEIQILDSFGKKKVGPGDMGGLYSIAAPKVNACKKPGEWQKLVIEYRAPRFDDSGKKTASFKLVKATLNGELIHENVEARGPTPGGLTGKEAATGPLMFQGDHGSVAFRSAKFTPARKK